MKILNRVHSKADLNALSFEELDVLCEEIREELLNTVSHTGGHLASNLGAVELTVALHNVFDVYHDRIVFDVGHQCYPHKMLTGRLDRFSTLRQEGGLSGFPKPSESDADAFVAGHASNAVSVALGMARARTLQGADYDVVAVLGDGALTGGLAFEGMNNAGQSREPLIIVLNDNGIAINHTVGAMAKYLTKLRLRPGYYRLKKAYRKIMNRLPGGPAVFRFTQRIKNRLKGAIFSCTMFESLGFRYLGPVDGHNVRQLSYMLKVAKEYKQPVLLHVVTKKGKGYPDAEAHPERYHGVGAFDPAVGAKESSRECFSSVFGETLTGLAKQDERICAITAAMESGTGLSAFHRAFPERFFDEGISEGHAVTMAAGMAARGMKPVFAVYSTFLQRSFDNLIHDVALSQLPVVLAVDRAGLVGADGETHNGTFDVGFLRQIPGMKIWCPASFAELRDMLPEALNCGGPAAIRYPRGGEGTFRDGGTEAVRVVQNGRDLSVVTYGILVNEALRAAEVLKAEGISLRVVKLGQIAPLDWKTVEACTYDTRGMIVAEDCAEQGSVGESLAANLRLKKMLLLNAGSGFVRQGTPASQQARCGIDAAGIIRAARTLMK